MEPEVKVEDYLITASDRCDACQAQAYVYVQLESGELFFCLHHWKYHNEGLSKLVLEVLDESERLLIR
jgi:hypothetical protein